VPPTQAIRRIRMKIVGDTHANQSAIATPGGLFRYFLAE
jgi:hypothetical protein